MTKINPADIGERLSVGEVPLRNGGAVSAIHFYEAKGLLTNERSNRNQRRNSRNVLRRTTVIKVTQRVGISLASISGALAILTEDRTPTVIDRTRLSRRWQAELDEKINTMMQLRNQLGDCIGCACLSICVCKLRNPPDELSESGVALD